MINQENGQSAERLVPSQAPPVFSVRYWYYEMCRLKWMGVRDELALRRATMINTTRVTVCLLADRGAR